MESKVLIKRGSNIEEVIPEDGEVVYNKSNHKFYIGDGKLPIKDLHGFDNIVKSHNGKMFFVDVDDNGDIFVKDFRTVIKGVNYDFTVPCERDTKTLKATDLIKKLINLVAIYGDLDVYIDGSYITNIYEESTDYEYEPNDSWIEIVTDYDVA